MPVDPQAPNIPGYTFQHLLGSGSTSNVYLYRQQIPQRYVAVKVSKSSLNTQLSENFLNEADMMAKISTHPHILTVYGAGLSSSGEGYIILEYAPGGTYKELIQTRTLSPDSMLDLGIKLGSALYTAHHAGIVHHDIKPGNILINSQGLPQLADFGTATSVYQSEELTGFSIPWAPPEVLMYEQGNEFSDIYSLGATMFATLVGSSPFEYGYHPQNLDELAKLITSAPIPSLDRIGIPQEVQRVLATSMAKDPDARYGSALQFVRAMQRAQMQCYGHCTTASVQDVAPLPTGLRATRDRRSGIRPVQNVPPHRQPAATDTVPAWRRPAILLSAGAVAIAALGVCFMTFIWPHLDAGSLFGNATTTVHEQEHVTETSPDAGDDTLNSASVPSPTELKGEYHGNTVIFTWKNDEPEDGDTYTWSYVDQDDGTNYTQAQIVTEPKVSLDDVSEDQTCIKVSIVRANRQVSATPTTACAVRP